MALAPIIDSSLQNGGCRLMLPIFIIVFGWSFGGTLPVIRSFLPETPGLENYSGMSLLATYAVARIYRIGNFEHRWRILPAMLAFSILLALSSIGLCEYNSPIAASLACLGFYLISKLHISMRLEKIIFLIAPSMFSVYIISVGDGWDIIEYFVLLFEPFSILLASVVAGLMVFLFALTIDLPRRLASTLMRKQTKDWLNKADITYAKIESGFSYIVNQRRPEKSSMPKCCTDK